MARNFFDNLPSTRTPFTAPRMNALLDGDEAMGNIVVDSIKTKNIFNENQILNASGWSKNSSGYYTGGISDLISLFRNNNFGTFEENTQYTFSWIGYLTSGSNVRFLITYTDNTTSQLAYINSSAPARYTGTTIVGKTISRVDVDAGNNGTLFIKNIQWEKGNTATDYVTYQDLGYVSGSKANGNYIKYDDGTLIQWGTINKENFLLSSDTSNTVQGIKFYRSNAYTLYTPLLFKDVNYSVFTQPLQGFTSGASRLGTTRTTKVNDGSFEIQMIGVESYTSSGNGYINLLGVDWLAIGRWK